MPITKPKKKPAEKAARKMPAQAARKSATVSQTGLHLLAKAKTLNVAWQDSEIDFHCRYHAEVDSIEWNEQSKVLRFYLLAEGEDDDYWMQLKFAGAGATLKWDDGEGVEVRAFKLFSGPAGLLLLDYRTRTEAISILIK